jgi:hypothetical protein
LERLDAAVRRVAEHVADRPRFGVTHQDADDVLGTIESDDAIGFAPLDLLRTLDRHGAHAVVIGQVAGIMHGSQELTGDLDLLWTGAASEAPAFAAAFAQAGAELWGDEGAPLAADSRSFTLPKVLFKSIGAAGDCCTPALPWSPSLDIAGIIERAEVTRDGEVSVRYASLTDLIDMRRASGRPKDDRRAAELAHLATASN